MFYKFSRFHHTVQFLAVSLFIQKLPITPRIERQCQNTPPISGVDVLAIIGVNIPLARTRRTGLYAVPNFISFHISGLSEG